VRLVEYRLLLATWRQKLADSGFDDIENADGSLRGQPTPPQSERSEYFRAIRELVNRPGFARDYCPRDQWILEMHADGATWVEILRKFRCDRNALSRVLRRAREEVCRG
jgi:hypothetical protein